MKDNRPHVFVLATGGTIATRGSSPSETTGYPERQGKKEGVGLLAEDLIASIPGIEERVRLSAESIFNVSSSSIEEGDLLRLAKRVNALLKEDVYGIVITHGTDTLEETAFFLHLTVKSDKPVVVVGAMLPATAFSADGPLNLYHAILTAAKPESRGKGVLVCMCGRLLSARDAAKTSTFRMDAFKCMEYGALGHVVGGDVRYYYAPVRPHTASSEFYVEKLDALPRVEIVYTWQGCTKELLKAAVEGGADGIVCAGMGCGAIPPEPREYYRGLSKKPPLVRGTRVFSGYTAAHGATPDDVYGTIPAGDFTVQKARILLQLALTVTKDIKEIRAIFQKY